MEDIEFTTSGELSKLLPALIAAKSDFGKVIKDAVNPHFRNKYAELGTVLDAVEPALLKNKLLLVQVPISRDGRTGVVTTLFHEGGQFIRGELLLQPAKGDPQAAGSAITYARRYAALSVCGVAPEDDDGEASAHGHEQDNRREPPANNGRLSSAQAKKEGWWELLTGEIDACRTTAELDTWKRRRSAEIKRLPTAWVDNLKEYYGKHAETFAPAGNATVLPVPDGDFPADWEVYRKTLATVINRATSHAEIDAILAANEAGHEACDKVLAGTRKSMNEHAEACKVRLADQKRAA